MVVASTLPWVKTMNSAHKHDVPLANVCSCTVLRINPTLEARLLYVSCSKGLGSQLLGGPLASFRPSFIHLSEIGAHSKSDPAGQLPASCNRKAQDLCYILELESRRSG